MASARKPPKLKPYRNLSGDSGVTAYAIEGDSVWVRFKGRSRPYRYGPTRPGAPHVARIARLAEAGEGLASYISRHVGGNYEPD